MTDTQCDVTEALEIFRALDEDKQQIVLAYLRELEKGAA